MASKPWLSHRGGMMIQASAESRTVQLWQKRKGVQEREKEKGRNNPSGCWLICFSIAFCTLPPCTNSHQEGSRVVMASLCCTLASRHRCTIQPSGYDSARERFLNKQLLSSERKNVLWSLTLLFLTSVALSSANQTPKQVWNEKSLFNLR